MCTITSHVCTTVTGNFHYCVCVCVWIDQQGCCLIPAAQACPEVYFNPAAETKLKVDAEARQVMVSFSGSSMLLKLNLSSRLTLSRGR